MIGRARELRLRAAGSERRLLRRLRGLLAVRTVHFLYTGARGSRCEPAAQAEARTLRVLVLMHPRLRAPGERGRRSRPRGHRVEDRVRRASRRFASSGTRCRPLGVARRAAPDPPRGRGVASPTSSSTCSRSSTASRASTSTWSATSSCCACPTPAATRAASCSRATRRSPRRCSPTTASASPAFAVFPRGQRVRRPRQLTFPLIVKSAHRGGVARHRAGVGRATTTRSLAERVRFIHESIGSDAIVEQYVEGRELYVGAARQRPRHGAARLGAALREPAPAAPSPSPPRA